MQTIQYVGPHEDGVVIPVIDGVTVDIVCAYRETIEVTDDQFVYLADQPDNWAPQGASVAFLAGVLAYGAQVWADAKQRPIGFTVAEASARAADYAARAAELTPATAAPDGPHSPESDATAADAPSAPKSSKGHTVPAKAAAVAEKAGE